MTCRLRATGKVEKERQLERKQFIEEEEEEATFD